MFLESTPHDFGNRNHPKPLFLMGKLTPDKDWNHDGTATTLEWNGDFMDITMPLKLVCFGNWLE